MTPKPLRPDAHILSEARDLAAELDGEDLDAAGGGFRTLSNVMKNRHQNAAIRDPADDDRPPGSLKD